MNSWKIASFIQYVLKISFQLKTLDGSKQETSTEQRDGRDNSSTRRHSHKDLKTTLSTLSFGGHDSPFGGEKRHSLRSNSSVMGKIKDRTGIPV